MTDYCCDICDICFDIVENEHVHMSQTGHQRSEAGDTANLLHGYFQRGLPKLIDRWADKWQREHPCPHLCAITTAIGHCKSLINLRSCTSDDALFNNDTTRFRIVSQQCRKLVGCYLYYDINLHRFVRSGKAYGREANIGKRIDAHAAGSLKGGIVKQASSQDM